MTQSKDSKNIWSIIGKVALVLTILWILIQMFNNFLKQPDYKLEISGNHASYQLPSDLRRIYNEYINILAVDSAIVEDSKGLNKQSKNSVVKISKNKSLQESIGIAYKIPHYSNVFESKLGIQEYKSFWRFTITNTGSKPLEELIIELPFDGFYSLSIKNKKGVSERFKQQIKIGELKPSYSATLKVWSTKDLNTNYPEWDEEKTRVTHKFGWEKIVYPKEVKGILAWNSRNDNFPLLIFVFVLVILFLIVFSAGMDYAPKYAEKEKRRKLKELEELEKLKAEENNSKEEI